VSEAASPRPGRPLVVGHGCPSWSSEEAHGCSMEIWTWREIQWNNGGFLVASLDDGVNLFRELLS